MNYELAKQLKEAGFPYDFSSTEWTGEYVKGADGEELRIPELSELINACGKERMAPNMNTEEKKPVAHLFRLGWGDEWFATYEFYDSCIDNGFGIPVFECGKTPEEAVAKLWLEINKKYHAHS